MSKTKQNIFAVLTVIAIVSLFSIFSYAKSSNYSFNMKYRVVDGKENKEFHSLNKGTVYITGEHYEYSADQGATTNNYDIYYALIRSRLWFDKKCGSVCFSIDEDPSGKLGTADKTSEKYYLQIYKVEDDGHNIKGSGTISN